MSTILPAVILSAAKDLVREAHATQRRSFAVYAAQDDAIRRTC
jgi:hypothetical protein